MARARWEMTAAQMAQFHNANRGKGQARAQPAQFNPFTPRRGIKVGVEILRDLVPKGRDA